MPERRWHPWRELRARPDVEFVLCDLPPGVQAIWARRGADRAILISTELGPAERLVALAHELVHDERGHPCHHLDRDNPYAAKEERLVDDIVAGRLLPPDELAVYVDVLAEFEPVTADAVAYEFDLPVALARRALDQLVQQRRSA